MGAEEGQGGIIDRSIAGDCDLALEPGFDFMSGLVAATPHNHPNPIMHQWQVKVV